MLCQNFRFGRYILIAAFVNFRWTMDGSTQYTMCHYVYNIFFCEDFKSSFQKQNWLDILYMTFVNITSRSCDVSKICFKSVIFMRVFDLHVFLVKQQMPIDHLAYRCCLFWLLNIIKQDYVLHKIKLQHWQNLHKHISSNAHSHTHTHKTYAICYIQH